MLIRISLPSGCDVLNLLFAICTNQKVDILQQIDDALTDTCQDRNKHKYIYIFIFISVLISEKGKACISLKDTFTHAPSNNSFQPVKQYINWIVK